MALKAILSERRVAVEDAPPAVYLLEERWLESKDWAPTVLLPVKVANLEGPYWLMRVSQDRLDKLPSMPETEGRYKLLNPPLGSMAA
jgi:hypothetical protein